MTTRTAPRTVRTFTFDVLDCNDQPIPGCQVRYNREDGYAAIYNDQLVSYAAGRDEAELLSRKAHQARQAAETVTSRYRGTIVQLSGDGELAVSDGLKPAITFSAEETAAIFIVLGEPAMKVMVGQALRQHLLSLSPRMAQVVEIAERAYGIAA